MAVLLLSHGIPMILAGDEVLRSQNGNNNCYCQDNEKSWFDWNLVEKNSEMLSFVKELIAFRKRHPSLMRRRFVTGEKTDENNPADISWHGRKLDEPPWHHPGDILACTMGGINDEKDLHIIFNMTDRNTTSQLPRIKGRQWYKAIDTAASSPNDIRRPSHKKRSGAKNCRVQARSIVVLESS